MMPFLSFVFEPFYLDQIFGPVLSVGRFKDEEEAIFLANDTNYGLGAGLHSSAFYPPVLVYD